METIFFAISPLLPPYSIRSYDVDGNDDAERSQLDYYYRFIIIPIQKKAHSMLSIVYLFARTKC